MNLTFFALTPDQRQFLKELSNDSVRYLLFGGYAVRYYGYDRPTDDIDLLIDRSEINIEKVSRALLTLKCIQPNLSEEALKQILVQPRSELKCGDIDIIPIMAGFDFETLYQKCKITNYDGFEIKLMSCEDLILCKQTSLLDPKRSEKHWIDKKDLEELSCGG